MIFMRRLHNRQRVPVSLFEKGLFTGVMLLLIGSIFLQITISNQATARESQLSQLNAQVTKVNSENASLQDEINHLRRPERLQRIAEQNGLTYHPDQIITVK